MSLEQKINEKLQSFPRIKVIVKYCYQRANVLFSKKRKYEGPITRISPCDKNYDYFFGYYDKSPMDKNNRYVLCLKTKDASKDPAPKESAEILLIDTEDNNSVKVIAKTRTWNVQQGCMMQWLGPDFDRKIIYNDLRDNQLCSVILNVFTGEERVLSKPVYAVSSDGKFGLSLDFLRLHSFRPGYGYSNFEDKTRKLKIPNGNCIYQIDLMTNKVIPIVSYETILNFEHKNDMDLAYHKVNHIMISPDNKRIMFMHRWFNGNKKTSRLITCDIDGNNMYNLLDDGMVSHCYWKTDREIIAYAKKNNLGNGYYLLKDKSRNFTKEFSFLTVDGHPSYCKKNKLFITDTYPNKKRISTIRVLSGEKSFIIAKVFSNFKYDNNTRCDLHPRWNYNGNIVFFDSTHEGKRGLYCVKLKENILNNEENINNLEKTSKKKIVYLMTSCKKCGPTQQTLNIIKNLDRNKYDPLLITLYEEEFDSRINYYLPFVSNHYFVKMSKRDILFGRYDKIIKMLDEIQPDIIHSVGVFPNYLISEINKYNHIFTLRNYVYDDYPAKFGFLRGNVLAKLQLKAIKETKIIITCSRSLQKIYKEKLNMNFDCVQNGVDLKKFKPLKKKEKKDIRKKIGFKDTDFVFVYSGQFIDRKNIPFLIDGFTKAFSDNEKLVLLGDGPKLTELKEKYSTNKNIIFVGNVDDMAYYLNVGDVYISTSKSEGLPNGVLEAMSVGLPVLLSDIEQHKEIIIDDKSGGLIYKADKLEDYILKLLEIRKMDISTLGDNARRNVTDNFSDVIMSKKYQNIYEKMK